MSVLVFGDGAVTIRGREKQDKDTALIVAAEMGNAEILDLLLKGGANMEARNRVRGLNFLQEFASTTAAAI